MKYLLLALGCLALPLSGCLNREPAMRQVVAPTRGTPLVQTARFELVDSSRHRVIPVAVYYPAAPPASATTTAGSQPAKVKLAIISHGYGVKNTEYSFVAQHLVAHGYYVASVQQDLPTDAPIPQGGDIQKTRYPYWKRGAENIAFAIRALRRRTPVLDEQPVLLLGHSYGGDIAMFFAQEYPALAQRVVSFDNCRVPLPRIRQPRIFSLSSSDQTADSGVVPTAVEQAEFGMTIIKLAAMPHNKMCDAASARQKQEMNQWISRFLETQ